MIQQFTKQVRSRVRLAVSAARCDDRVYENVGCGVESERKPVGYLVPDRLLLGTIFLEDIYVFLNLLPRRIGDGPQNL